MMGPSRRVACLIAITAAACAGDTTVDPGDLELRDLLGIAPEIASAWNADQRAAARRVLIAGLADDDAPSRAAIDPTWIDPAEIGPATPGPATIAPATTGPTALAPAAIAPAAIALDDRVARLLAAEDARRADGGAEPLGVVRVAL